MMKSIKFALVGVALVVAGLVFTKPALANEGIIQMEGNDGTGARCEIFSVLLSDFNYKLVSNCRGLKYPISENLFQYVMWADHGDNKPTRLGTLGVGKGEYSSSKPFSRVFVTKEAGRDPDSPSNFQFMSGIPSNSAYLDHGQTSIVVAATPVPDVNQVQEVGNQAPANQQSVSGVIRILGIFVIVVVLLVVVIALISASRRRPVNI